jgi:hypothetical protein
MQRIEGRMCKFIIPQEAVELVDRIKERHQIKEAQAIRAIFLLGFEFYEDLEKLGIPQTASFIERFKNKLQKERFFSEKKVINDLSV